MRILVLIPLLAGAVCAQDMVLRMDLSGTWKIHSGEDRIEFAQPGFDDSGWREIAVPARETAPVGIWWMRRTVQLPSDANLADLALTIGGINEVFELYVNGEQVAAVGTIGSFATSPIARPRTFPLPTLRDRKVTIALRLWRTVWSSLPERERRDEGPWLLTSRANAPPPADLVRRERMATPNLILAALMGVLATILLVGWSTQRSRTDLVLLAAFLLCETARRGYPYVSIAMDWPHAAHAIGAVFTTLSNLFLAWYAANSLGGWARCPVPFLGFNLANHVMSVLGFLFYSVPLPWTIRSGRLRPYIQFAMLAGVVIEGVRALRNGDKPKVRMAAALTLLILLNDQERGFLAQIGMLAYPLATFLLSMALTVHLIRSLGEAHQRLDQELQAARVVQQMLIPESAVAGVEAVYLPAQEVGGDFWQALPCADGGLLIVVGDVSGKGLRAAMVVSLVVGVVRSRRDEAPEALLSEINRALLEAPSGGFVTCCVAKVPADGRVLAANAGHCPPYRDGAEVDLPPGLPLGVTLQTEWTSGHLDPGPLMFLSDGVVEAANAKGELFGFERTRAISGKAAGEIADAAREWGQNDDITVVTVRRSG